MRRFPPLLSNSSAKARGPNIKTGPNSDKLWKVYQRLLLAGTDKNAPEAPPPECSEEGYYLTSTILDLDAADSPLTRAYNEQDHTEQVKKWGTNHALEALTKRMHAFRDEVEVAKTSWKKSTSKQLRMFDERYITERDILSMAFLGPGTSRNQVSKELLKSIGIYPRIIADDISLTVRYLAHRRETQQQQSCPSADAEQKKRPKAVKSTGSSTTQQQPKLKTEERDLASSSTVQNLRCSLQKASLSTSIPRILYHLLSDDRHLLIARCLPEIISASTREIEIMSPEDAIQCAIFLRNLAYNLTITKQITLDFQSSRLLDGALQRLAERYGEEGFPVTAAKAADITKRKMASALKADMNKDVLASGGGSGNGSGVLGEMMHVVSGADQQQLLQKQQQQDQELPLHPPAATAGAAMPITTPSSAAAAAAAAAPPKQPESTL